MSTVSMSTNFPKVVASEMFNKVRGESALAKLCPEAPIAFTGTSVFTFSMDKELELVAENGAKGVGDGAAAPVNITPLKVVYNMRVSDEFLYAAEEHKLQILDAFQTGFARKLANALDLMFIHGVNPATNTVSASITNYFDTTVTNTVALSAASGKFNDGIVSAIALLTGYDANGILIGKNAAAGLYAETSTTNGKDFTALGWGGANVNEIMGLRAAVSGNVDKAVKASALADAAKVDETIVGDFSAFRWGIAKELPIEVIRYGDPDGAGTDLARYNQVCLRGEAWIGAAILDANAFARVTPYVESEGGGDAGGGAEGGGAEGGGT